MVSKLPAFVILKSDKNLMNQANSNPFEVPSFQLGIHGRWMQHALLPIGYCS